MRRGKQAKIYTHITQSLTQTKRDRNAAFVGLEWRGLARATDRIEWFVVGTEAKVKRLVAGAGSRRGRMEEEVGIEVRGRMGRGGLKGWFIGGVLLLGWVVERGEWGEGGVGVSGGKGERDTEEEESESGG